MKRIDLGEGAVAFEGSVAEDRADMVSDEFFKRNKVSDEAARIYERFRKGVQGASPDAVPSPGGPTKFTR